MTHRATCYAEDRHLGSVGFRTCIMYVTHAKSRISSSAGEKLCLVFDWRLLMTVLHLTFYCRMKSKFGKAYISAV